MKTWHKVAIGSGVVVVLGGIVLFSVNQANKGMVTVQTAKVTKQALINASSIAGLMLTTEALVSEIKEEKEPAAGAGGPGGMGGMY